MACRNNLKLNNIHFINKNSETSLIFNKCRVVCIRWFKSVSISIMDHLLFHLHSVEVETWNVSQRINIFHLLIWQKGSILQIIPRWSFTVWTLLDFGKEFRTLGKGWFTRTDTNLHNVWMTPCFGLCFKISFLLDCEFFMLWCMFSSFIYSTSYCILAWYRHLISVWINKGQIFDYFMYNAFTSTSYS